MTNLTYRYHEFGPYQGKLSYIHVYNTERMDGGCFFFGHHPDHPDLHLEHWIATLFKVRHGQRTAYINHHKVITFGQFHTTFHRMDSKGDYYV